MRFVIDAQLPWRLADALRDSGLEAEHVAEIGLGDATDQEVWRHICRRKAILVTKDQDFTGMASEAPEGAAVIWIRLGNTANRVLWTMLEPLLPEILAALQRGEKLIEITG